MKMCKT